MGDPGLDRLEVSTGLNALWVVLGSVEPGGAVARLGGHRKPQNGARVKAAQRGTQVGRELPLGAPMVQLVDDQLVEQEAVARVARIDEGHGAPEPLRALVATEGGFAVLDAPGQSFYREPDESGNMRLVPGGEWEIYYNTIRAAGFEAIVPFRSELEADNPMAFALLDAWEGTPDYPDPMTGEPRTELRVEWMGRMVARLLSGSRHPFIVMWKGDAPAVGYRDLGIELSILNERRFDLSFPPPFPSSSDIDMRWVNSILLPRLPTTDIWSVRRPWN